MNKEIVKRSIGKILIMIVCVIGVVMIKKALDNPKLKPNPDADTFGV